MQPGDIFGGGRQNGCDCLLYLSTKYVCENFGGVAIAWFRPRLVAVLTQRA